MSKYLLDTNVISEAIKAIPNQGVMEALNEHRDEIAIAAPVWHELEYGCQRLPVSKKRTLVEKFLVDVVWRTLPILPYDQKAASWHAVQRARLTSQGNPPSFVDGQIAAIAIVNKCILVTRNTSDFDLYSDLTIQNWHK